MIKFLVSSAVGLFLFFAPAFDGKIPLVALVNYLKDRLGDQVLNVLVLLVCSSLLVTLFMAKVLKNEKMMKQHETDGPIKIIMYILAVVFTLMVMFKVGPEAVLHKDIGGLAVYLARSVMLTVTLAGWFVILILKSGIVEFVGVLIEPVMRPVFKLPGCAAVNGIASFVSAPAVGVFMTEQLYKGKSYTHREAVTVLTCFSVCSLGFFGVLVSLGKIEWLYPQVVGTSFIVTFVMAAICGRIPPMSTKKDVYFDGTLQTEEERRSPKVERRFQAAVDAGIERSRELDMGVFMGSLWDAMKFTQIIVPYVVSIATISLILAERTPLFTYLGMPMIPILNLLGMPNADIIAPSTLIGIAELALPVIMIAGKGVAVESMFFITVLSSVQIIFFTESANAMLESAIPVSVTDLVLSFFVRTLVAMPILAAVTHLLVFANMLPSN